MTELLIWALALPLASFVLLGCVWPLRHTGKLAGVISSLAATGSLVMSVRAFLLLPSLAVPEVTAELPWLVMDGKTIATLGLHADGISLGMLVVVTLVACCVQWYSLGYLADEPPAALGRYYTWQSLFIVAMGGLVLAPNLLQLFACWELVGLCSYLLIGFYWKKQSAAKAAVKAFWVTKFADMGLMLGLIVLFTQAGSFDWTASLGDTSAILVAGLLFMGVMGKSAQVPLHVWLPDAMEGPTPVSALLHAATMVAAGVFLIVRAYPIFEQAPAVLSFMVWIGALTALFAGIIAVVQTDIKKVLAYSTCSQLGYMISALGSGALVGGYFHLTTHAFFKALLFLGAGAAIHAVHSNDIRDMGGLLKKTPVSAVLFIIGALALAGVPGLAGFFSKDLILEELLHAGHLVPMGILVFTAALTAFYMARVVAVAFFAPAKSKGAQHAHESPLVMLLPMAVLAIPAAGAGYFGSQLAQSWGHSYAFHVAPVGIVTSALGLTALVAGFVMYRKGLPERPMVPVAVDFILAGRVDRFWDLAYRRGLLVVSRGLGWTDRYVVDGLLNMVGWAAIRGGEQVRKLQTGRARDYVFAVVAGVILFVAYGAIAGAS